MSASEDRSTIRRGDAFSLPHGSDALWFLVFVAAYYLAYRYGMSFSQISASPFWFPDSILLCALLKARPRNWWILVLATLPIRLFSEVVRDIPLWFLVGTFAIDAAKGVLAALLLRRLIHNPLNLQTIREVAVFVGVAAVAIPAVAAFGGAALRSSLGYDFWTAWEQWFQGNALTQLVVTPFILYWIFDIPWRNWSLGAWRYVEAGCLLVGLVLTGYLAAHTDSSAIYFSEARWFAPVPFLFWAAIRFGMAGAAGAIGIVSFFTIAAAISGTGPYAGQSPSDVAMSLQDFLLLRSLPLYFVAAAIEQSKQAERSLRESEESFRRMAQSAPVLIWMSGTDKRLTFVNQMWLEFTGRTLQEELGIGWAEGVHAEDLKHCLERYGAAFDAQEPFVMEYRLRREDGEYRWILDKGVPRYAPDGSFAGYIGSAIDITNLKHAEETNRALAHAQRLAVMGELAAAIAHEVRQPLSAIALNAEAAERLIELGNPPWEDMRDMVADIRGDVARANAVISRVNTFVRKNATEMQALDPNAVVLDVLGLVSADAMKRDVHIQTDLDLELPPVLGNKTQLQQVLMNLIVNGMNAMDRTPREKRWLSLQTKLAGDEAVEVVLTDRGTGIAPDQLPLLFNSFFTTRPDGMGLGLAIARSAVVAHRGRIWAENNADGDGATFHFTVPVYAGAEVQARPGAMRA